MKRRGNSLAGVLAAVAVVMILLLVLFLGRGGIPTTAGQEAPKPRADGKGKTVLGGTKYAAYDSDCKNNLSQVRLSIQVATTSGEDAAPSSLNDLHLPHEILVCPIPPHEPYTYDPKTGQVHCPHPGHEAY